MRHRSIAASCVSILIAALALSAAPARALDGTWIRHDPGPRFAPGFVMDPASSRIILFGGYDGTGFLKAAAFHQDTWELNVSGDPKWKEYPTAGNPPPRQQTVMVLDPTRNRIVMFGGKTSTTMYNDLWTFDLASNTWSPLAASGTPPTPREAFGIYDPVRDRLVLFGGHQSPPGIDLNETWQLSFGGTPTWSPLATAGTPPSPRRAGTMIYDPFGDRAIVFGGYSQATNTFLNETWALSLSGTPTWTQLTPSGTPPSGRQGHLAIYDPVQMRMIVFSGFNGPWNFLNDMYALSLGGSPSWSALSLGGPTPLERDFSAMEYDVNNDRLVLMGGNTPIANVSNGCGPVLVAEVLGDVWTVKLQNIPTATQVSTAQPEASPDRVRLRWQVSTMGQSYEVFRTEGSTVWERIGDTRPEAGGMVTWDDRDVKAGHSYSYRLRYPDGETMRFGGDISVVVPRDFQLAVSAPAVVSNGSLSFEVTLPSRGDARVGVFDVSGRRVFEQSEARDAGRHVIDLGSNWAPGVYWVRVDHAGVSAQQKVAILR